MRPSIKKILLFGTTAPYVGAMLALDFVGSRSAGTPYYMLNGVRYPTVTAVPGWTYTGGTPAGTGSYAPKSDGSLQFFPSVTNLVLQSQTFGTTWTTVGTPTISSDAVVAPDGTTTADRITSGASGNSGVYQTPSSSPNGVAVTQSIYVSTASTATVVRLGADYGPTTAYLEFNPSTGLITVNGAGIASSSVQNVGGGWYRVQWSFVTTAIGSSFTVYSRSGVGSTVVIWGAQLELGSTASTYIPTTTAAVTVAPPRITDAGYLAEEARTNLLVYSQDFTTQGAGFWQLQASSTVSGNAATAPDGTATADLWTRVTTAASYFTQTKTKAASATTYTHSMYVKKSVGNYYAIRIQGTYPARVDAVFDLSTGTIATAAVVSGSFTSPSATIEPAANGFYLVTITATSDATTALQVVGSFLSTNVQVDGTDSASNSAGYIWQADLQVGSFATSPIPTTSVAVTRAADVGYISGLTVPSAFTYAIQVVPNTVTSGSFPYAVALSDGTNNNRFEFYGSTANAVGYVASGGTAQFNNSVASVSSVGSASRDAISVSGTALLRAMNGVTRTGGTLSSSPASAVTRLEFKTGSASYFAQKVTISPRAASADALQAVTIGPVSFANDNAPDDMRAALWGWAA